MDDKTKELIRNHLRLLKEHNIWCVHNRVSICIKCNAKISGNLSNVQGNLTYIRGNLTGISGNLTNVRGNLTGICGNLTYISGDFTGIRATADEIKEVLRELEWEKEL